MIYTLKNNHLEITANSSGAELISLIYKEKELLWQAKDPWKRHAPILFPIVGKIKNNRYIYKHQTFALPQHGFVRDKEWLCTLCQNNTIEFELIDDDISFQQYPFYFSLIVRYKLEQSALNISFNVFNPYHYYLPFSIGYHPAFNTNGNRHSCYLKIISNHNTLERTLLQDGLLTSEKEPLKMSKNMLFLNEELFVKDAIVLENTDIQEIILCNDEWNYEIQVKSLNCKNWGIWTKKNCANFICIEPWMGIADKEDVSGIITEKKDIILLSPYQEWSWNIQIKVVEK